ncbi:leucyl/phenylalanyl-tRNA--protein transferase [Kineococcus sp. NUM-3379]
MTRESGPPARPRAWPVDPGPSRLDFTGLRPRPGEDLVAAGGDLRPATLLAAYRTGYFPMGLGRGGTGPLGWWSPDPRGVLLPHEVHVSRSLRRSLRGFEIRVDTAFAEVVAGCADPSRPGAWITDEIAAAYLRLHRTGWAHSVEAWAGGELVGGLYGLAIGGFFAAESKFHRARDASKAAVVGLARILTADGVPGRLVDVQWCTPHLATLGVRELDRRDYRRALAAAAELPTPHPFTARPDQPSGGSGG